MRDSSVTVVCWHIEVNNLQRYILNHGPARPGPSLVSAFHPVQPRPCLRPSPNCIQSSRVTLPGRLSQSSKVKTPAIRVQASAIPPSAQVHYSWSTAGTLDVYCMCIRIVSNPLAWCPRCVAMTRQSYISGGSARSESSKSGPLVSAVGAPAADSAR